MSEETGQNLANHTVVPKQASAVIILGLITIILGVVGLITENVQVVSAGFITAGLGIAGGMVTARLYCTSLQDRIIRTEMRIRMRDVLDADLAAKGEGLSKSQLVGLRFASDEELAGLLQKVLDENIAEGGDIKKLVTDWQGDYHRV